MHVAIEGCSHGELDIIYRSIQRLEEIHNFKIDLLLCCGDFQSVRNERDLKCMAVPTKYMQMQDFHEYYSGEKVAPVLTIFIGGNHEASNYLQELPYGGWVAPNIYYLGYAGIVRFGGLRIGGLSGIYKGVDYLKGHFERSPYTNSTLRSVYHVRNLEVFRLKQLSGDTDIFMSHDWPRGIYHHGNVKQLLKFKSHFAEEIKSNTLGSRPAEDLIKKLKPQYWFAGHLHVKFSAVLKHKGENNDENKVTKFLALDKCLPRREFLQVLELPVVSSESLELQHDPEWLTILRLTNHLLSTSSGTVYMPGPGSSERYNFTPSPEEIEETMNRMGGDLKISPSNFSQTAQVFNSDKKMPNMNSVAMPTPLMNPQTTNLCSRLQIDDPLWKELQSSGNVKNEGSSWTPSVKSNRIFAPMNKSEMDITVNSFSSTFDTVNHSSFNPEEVNLSDGDEIEICKDEESGDFILEVPSISSFNSSKGGSPSFNLSPIRGNGDQTPQDIFSSPVSSSPRYAKDHSRKTLSLSRPRDGNSSCSCTPSSEEGTGSPQSQADDNVGLDSSPASFSDVLRPLSLSSQSEEESDTNTRNASVKRDSSCDEAELQVQVKETEANGGRTTNKKVKRRNASLYSNDDGS